LVRLNAREAIQSGWPTAKDRLAIEIVGASKSTDVVGRPG
jgi:hypothetical protein